MPNELDGVLCSTSKAKAVVMKQNLTISRITEIQVLGKKAEIAAALKGASVLAQQILN